MPPHSTSPATPRVENTPVEQRHTVRIGPKMSSTAHKAKNLTRDEKEEEEVRPIKRARGTICARKRASPPRIVRQREEVDPFKRLPRMMGTINTRNCATALRIVRHAPTFASPPQRVAYPLNWGEELDEDEDEVEEEEQEPDREYVRRKTGVARKCATPVRMVRRRVAAAMELANRRKLAAFNRNGSNPVKRKRGRPRLSSPRVISKTKVKIEELQVDIPVVAQPRATNGRFGKKDKSSRKSREYTAVGSTVADDDDPEPRSPRRKRGIDAVEDFEEPPEKRSASEQNPGGNDLEVVHPGQKVIPRPASSFRGGRLFSNPNPLRFALHAWAGPLILDESSDDDEKQPETPEDSLSSAADIAPTEELMDSMFLPSILPRAPPLTCKPSPFVFAKNRWNSTSAALNKVIDNNRSASINSTPSDDNLRSNLRTSHVLPEEEVILFFTLRKVSAINTSVFVFFRSPDFPLLIARTYLKVILPQCGPMTKPTCLNCDTCILCSLLVLHL